MSQLFSILMSALFCLCLGGVAAFLWRLCSVFAKKARVETVVQIQCSSGDSEVMSFNCNFMADESTESKQFKINEAFGFIQDRRDENHEKFLAISAQAKQENEELLANGGRITPTLSRSSMAN